ncbi:MULTISPECIES: ABC transporter permease [Ruegeria]|uniref:ABC transporter permease subunit n=1 Tax=Ruegeria atlantica TaxID=81569 RepID=A0ABX1W704_9RHOB|nr:MULTISPECIES: ABC transporter permease [Ruegeria]NOC43941.1 ABC transporter permease subunit [Ruegeria sp. HKCCD7559]NOC84200.1 ABC transporter permease subunit [Ruegeria sp. HKCCD6428]NOD28673.1 ABC transporter permease subunit [Ruegeria atlantica]NOD82671.1 ABC transporter permease subunit [Ruegeria sp. HKCCD6119]NOE25165.1 ABC transporter permease subunit [Ruegeria sp. HKCCD6157]
MHPIIKLVSQRLALGILLLFGASALIFGLTEALPGDAAQAVLGQSATPEALANLREEMGLNRPALTRYFEWLGGIVQGDLGQSLTNKLDIAESIGKRLGNTLFLACVAAIVSVPLAIFLGLLAVRFRNRWPDKLISAVTLTTVSIPEFLIGYVVIYYISVKLGWFSSLAMINDSMSFWQKLNAIALPAFVLTLVVLAQMMRMTRAAILNLMQSAYIETAELKGLSTFQVIARHAFPNAISPIVNVVMLNLAYLVVGVVVVEVVFVYPGMGQYLVDAVTKRDVPVVLACGVVFAAVYIGLNMVADIVSILANPRLRHPK